MVAQWMGYLGVGPSESCVVFTGLDSKQVHAKFPGIAFLPEYRLHEFIDHNDVDSLIMSRHPKQLSDVDDFLAEERFYE